jgi:glycosyltransferase involved in cell wall biosynthesis
MPKSTISIALCTYNGARYLSAQLESIAAQTRLPDELVVCDDGSTDGTAEIVRRFAERMSFPVRFHVNDRKLGSTKNFEMAIRLCTGEIVALADQDDVWLPEKLERITAAFAKNPRLGTVFSDALVVDADLEPVGYRLWESQRFTPVAQKRMRQGDAFRSLVRHNMVNGNTMAFLAKHRDLLLPIPETWSHDAWIALMTSAVSELAMLQEPLVLYRQHANSQMGTSKIPKGRFRFKRQRKTRPGVAPIDKHAAKIEPLTLARERLLSLGEKTVGRPKATTQIEAAIRHLQARDQMLRIEKRWRRLAIAIKETASRRYWRYSKGYHSLAVDLFRRKPEQPAVSPGSDRAPAKW